MGVSRRSRRSRADRGMAAPAAADGARARAAACRAGPVGGRAGQAVDAGAVAWYRTTVRASRPGDHALRVGSANHHAIVRLDGRRVCAHRGAYEPFACVLRLRDRAAHRLGPARRLAQRDPRLRPGVVQLGRARVAGASGARWAAARSTRPSWSRGCRARRGAAWRSASRCATGRRRHADGPRARDAAPGGRVVRVRFPARRVGARRGSSSAGTRWSSARRCGRRGGPRCTTCASPCPVRPCCAGATGLREIAWDAGRAAAQRPVAAPRRRVAAARRARPRRRAARGRPRPPRRRPAHRRANAVRAQFPLSDELLDRLDAAGILVWQHVGPWDPAGAFSSATAPRCATGPAAARSPPPPGRPRIRACSAWNLGNEVAGQGHPAGQAAYVDAAARDLHRLDPGRPVAVDVWGTHAAARARAAVPPPRRARHQQLQRAGTSWPARPAAEQEARRWQPRRGAARGLPRQAGRGHRVRRRRRPAQRARPARRRALPGRASSRGACARSRGRRAWRARWSSPCATTPTGRCSTGARPRPSRPGPLPARRQRQGPVPLRRHRAPERAGGRGRVRADAGLNDRQF